MPGINPIQGPTPSVPSPSAGGAKPNSSPRGADFSRMLRDYVTRVDGAQQTSASAIQDLVSGKTEDIVSTVAAVAKADLSFKLLIGVRNKVIEAYKQTMNMLI